MSPLRIIILALVGAVVATELMAPSYVSARAESQVATRSSGRLTVDASVSGPPLVVPVLATGNISRFSFRLIDVASRPVPVTVIIDAEGISVDRVELLTGTVVIEGVDAASVLVDADLRDLVPPATRPLVATLVERGLAELLETMGETLGLSLEGERLQILGDALVLELVGGPQACEVDLSQNLHLTASCTLRQIPPVLLTTLQASP